MCNRELEEGGSQVVRHGRPGRGGVGSISAISSCTIIFSSRVQVDRAVTVSLDGFSTAFPTPSASSSITPYSMSASEAASATALPVLALQRPVVVPRVALSWPSGSLADTTADALIALFCQLAPADVPTLVVPTPAVLPEPAKDKLDAGKAAETAGELSLLVYGESRKNDKTASLLSIDPRRMCPF